MNNKEIDLDTVVLNYENIAHCESMSDVTRVLALYLMKNPYLVVGDYFKNLSDSSLRQLAEIVEKEDDESVSETLLISEMLSKGEGVENSVSEMGRNVGVLRIYVAGTLLHRKGLVKLHYENMTFGHEFDHKVIIEKINLGDEYF